MNIDFLNNVDEYIVAKRYRLVNALLVYQNDGLIFERYYNKHTADSRNKIKSVWKSVLSITLGICLDKGLIQSIDEPIGNYLGDFAKNIHPYHKLITIRHLLTMSSGIYWNGGIHFHCPMVEQMLRSRDWIAHIADVKMVDVPGLKFVYKEWDVILLSALIGKASGSSAWDVCREYLYKPLNISSDKWTQSKCGVDYPSVGMDTTSDLSARDMLKIGLLMLQGGKWEGSQILPSEYVRASVQSSEASPDYGFLWWLSEEGFHGRGAGGQEINVYHKKKIIAILQSTYSSSAKNYADICKNIME